MALQIGQILYGFCGGHFGRDFAAYHDKRIEAVGVDWVVVRDEKGNPNFACGVDTIKFLQTDVCTKPQDENYEDY